MRGEAESVSTSAGLVSIRKRTAVGFTLIELLVVIAIISLLVSIFVPSLQKVRVQARLVVCLATLRNHQIALAQYANENNDFYPQMYPHPFAGNPFSFRLSFRDALADRYGLQDDAWVCPSFPSKLRAENGGTYGKAYDDLEIDRYVAGYLVLAGGNGYGSWRSMDGEARPYNGEMARVTDPNAKSQIWLQHITMRGSSAEVVLLGDYVMDGYYGTIAPHSTNGGFLQQPGPGQGAPASDSLIDVCEKSNEVFEDGSAQTVPLNESGGIESYDAGWGYFFWW